MYKIYQCGKCGEYSITRAKISSICYYCKKLNCLKKTKIIYHTIFHEKALNTLNKIKYKL